MTKDLLQAYQDAIQVQDACNLSGVLYSWARHMKTLRDIMWNENKDQEWLNTHPVNVLFASKVSSLVHMECLSHDSMDRFHEAYSVATQVVEEHEDKELVDA
ncbi:MAG: hypothetical protein ACXAEN_23840 [Candidatus Thorarchaeota archaeon]|jgi:hypothetical protein